MSQNLKYLPVSVKIYFMEDKLTPVAASAFSVIFLKGN
jgi:hypothetical protein